MRREQPPKAGLDKLIFSENEHQQWGKSRFDADIFEQIPNFVKLAVSKLTPSTRRAPQKNRIMRREKEEREQDMKEVRKVILDARVNDGK